MPQAISAERIRSGSHGELWMDGELSAETYGFQAKITKNKETVPRCGAFIEGHKLISARITGSMRIYNASSRFLAAEGAAMKNGKDLRHTFISKLDDPDAVSVQRIMLTGVSFDDLTLADWEAAKLGTIEAPFTADGYEILEY